MPRKQLRSAGTQRSSSIDTVTQRRVRAHCDDEDARRRLAHDPSPDGFDAFEHAHDLDEAPSPGNVSRGR